MSTNRASPRRSKGLIAGFVVLVLLALVGSWALVRELTSSDTATAFVGDDLHAVTQDGDRVFVSGHSGAAYADRPGAWRSISTLDGADAMAWSVGRSDIIVGGHQGAFRSTDGGMTFAPVAGLPVTDVHAVGTAGSTAYFASPTGGFYSSKDSGVTWEQVNQMGGSFMGSLLVDPDSPSAVLAADMLQGVVRTSDGGRTWTVLGGIEGPMGLNWNPSDHQQIVVTASRDAGISLDGGTSWFALPIPAGTGSVTFDATGRLLAAVLTGRTATVMTSNDLGATWSPL